jgi:hypothetical protein
MKNKTMSGSIKNHLLINARLFVKSFTKPGWNFFYSMLADMLQFALTIILIVLLLFMLKGSIMPLITQVMPTAVFVNSYASETGSLPPMTEEMKAQLDSDVNVIRSFFIKSILSIFVFIALLLLVSSLFRSYVYSRLHKIGYFDFAKKFTIRNFLWYLFFGIVIIISFFSFKLIAAGYAIASIILFMIIFTPIYRSFYDVSIKKFYSSFFLQGTFGIYRLFIPFAAMGVVIMITMLLLSKFINIVPGRVMAFLLFMYIFAAIGWVRHYIFISADEFL